MISGHKVKVFYQKKYDNFLLFSLRIAFNLLFSFRFRPDWIIARSTDGLFSAIFCRMLSLKTRTVLHSHGWEEKVFELEQQISKHFLTNRTTWKAHFLRFPLLRLSLKLSSVCLAGTIEEARWIKAHYPHADNKIKVITNGTIPLSKPFWFYKDLLPLNFLIVGGFTWKKNIQYGISLFNNIRMFLPQSRLWLVGTGKSIDFLNYTKTFDNSIFVVENEPLETMYKWYFTCPFLISTSRYEGGYSLAILEALARGAIVFATSIPSSREFITDFYNGVLLDGKNEMSDTEKIKNVIYNKNLIKKISMNGWKKITRYSWKKQSLKLEKILNNFR